MDSEQVLPLLWSGLFFKATMALTIQDNEDRQKFLK
jgi:hypothetical protein